MRYNKRDRQLKIVLLDNGADVFLKGELRSVFLTVDPAGIATSGVYLSGGLILFESLYFVHISFSVLFSFGDQSPQSRYTMFRTGHPVPSQG